MDTALVYVLMDALEDPYGPGIAYTALFICDDLAGLKIIIRPRPGMVLIIHVQLAQASDCASHSRGRVRFFSAEYNFCVFVSYNQVQTCQKQKGLIIHAKDYAGEKSLLEMQ
ncbi:MAG: hypothetical protein GVY19_14165 [Bacteroidetes bacterium]|nr:hypothetical protein [Bacteroidota bacterium]